MADQKVLTSDITALTPPITNQPTAVTGIAPTLPAPVTSAEYYTGFTEEFKGLGVELQSIYSQLQQAEKKLTQPIPLQLMPEGILKSISATNPFTYLQDALINLFASKEAKQAATRVAQAEFDALAKQFQLAEWKMEIMQVLPIYLADPSYKIEKSEDILQYVAPGVDLSDADSAWLKGTFDKLSPLMNVLPEGYSGDVLDAQSQILNNILTAPKLEMKGVHHLTIDEIAKSFAFGVAELPAGMSEEDVRNLLSKMDLNDEELKSQREWLAERAREWETESARMSLIRSGEILADVPELTPLQWAKMIVTQPMMATVELMQKWWDTISRPIATALIMNLPAPAAGAALGAPVGIVAGGMAGALVGAIGGPFGMAGGAIIGAIAGAIGGAAWLGLNEADEDKELTKHYEFYRSQGDSAWSSYAQAFNAWEAPWWKKMLLDSAYDPMMWIGWGGVAAVGRKLTTVALPRGLKMAGTRVGTLMVAFENGYTSGMDAIFKAGMQVAVSPIKGAFWLTGGGYAIPKTFTQMARNFARGSMMDFKSVLDRTFPTVRNLRGLTVKDVSNTAEAVVKAAMTSPMEGNNLMVRAGSRLLEFGYLDDVAASKLLKDIAGEVAFDTPRLARVNNLILDAFSGQGDRITAGKILGELGVEATEDSVNTLATRIVKIKDTVAKNAVNSIKGDTADEMLLSIFNRLESTRYANLHSPLTQYMQQAGRSASWHSRVADRILYSSQLVSFERRVVMPFARWQLLFFNFGPWNYAENMMRSQLGGAEIMRPSRYSGVAETNRLFRGLTNAPYELQMFERGQTRTVQAIIDPKTGATTVFKRGNIPFITRDVTIPDKVPFLGGKNIGLKINIGGKQFDIGSATDVYDMWSHIGSNQMAYDYQVHYMKALAEADPETMKALSNIIEVKTRGMLDDIASITSRDAGEIRRELLQEATIGPDAVRAHADIDVIDFQRRQISKELNRTFDKMTDIHTVTKKAIENDVLDGTMFTKGATSIDDRIVAHAASERELSIAGLSYQMDALQAETKAFLVNPPKNLQEFLGDMQNITSHIESVGETIHDYRRITELRKAKLNPADFDNFEVGSAKMLAAYMDTSEEQLTKMMNQLVENAKAMPLPFDVQDTIKGIRTRQRWIDVKFPDTPKGYRVGFRSGEMEITQGKAATEGEGLYISRNRETAWFFSGDKPPNQIFIYKEPSNPLIVGGEILPSLSDPDILFESVKKSDSVWIRLNKQAAMDVGLTADNFDQIDILFNKRLSELARSEGYDSFRISEQGADYLEDWEILLDDFLWKDTPIWQMGTTQVLNDVQLARLADLDSITRLEFQNTLATRTKIAEIESAITSTPRKLRNDRFWLQQRASKSAVWDEFDNVSRKLKSARLGASRNFLMSVDKPVYVPDFVPEVTGDLTANHLAYLYGVTGDDLYRGLTRVQNHMTVRPKEDFILHTKDQASAYAAKFGKTADELGFTDEAIGEVYDQMWKSLGVDPMILTPDSPTMLQLEEVRQEIQRLYASTKIPESDVIKWRQYVNAIADGVGETGAYKAAAGVPAVAPTVIETGQPYTAKLFRGTKLKGQPPTDEGLVGKAQYWSTSEAVAQTYDAVKEATINLQKPYVIKTQAEFDDFSNMRIRPIRDVAEAEGRSEDWVQTMLRSQLENEGYDGVVIAAGIVEKGTQVAVFYPEKATAAVPPIEVFAEEHVMPLMDKMWSGEVGRDIDSIVAKYFSSDALDNYIKNNVGFRKLSNQMANNNAFRTELKSYLKQLGLPDEFKVFRGMPKGGKLPPDYVNVTVNPGMAEDFKFFKGAGVPDEDWIVNSYKVRLDDVVGVGAIHEGELFVHGTALRPAVAVPPKAVVPTVSGTPEWWATKEQAMTKAREMHKLAYPTYDDANIIDETMRAIFPFWNYELFRWKWLPRTFMRTPGVMSGLARYMEYTDSGYMPVPGTDLQINILRGTVFMGGLRSFYLKDFPEYHDSVPGVEFLDYIGRAGFFPGIHVMLPIVMFGAAGKQPQLGQLAPAWVKTGLSALRALSPQHIGAVLDIVYPDRFRDYMTMMELGSMGYDADEIWKKKQQGTKLTDEEERLWLQAVNKVDGVKGILMNQTGLFRIRPQEFTQLRQQMQLAIQDATGVPVKTQDWIDKMYPVTGKRFTDYFHLDIQQQALLYQWESYRRYQGITTPLYPSSWQALDIKISDYYQELDKVYNDARYNGVYENGELVQPSIADINRQLIEGTIGPSQWRSLRDNILSGLSEAVRVLGESPAYADVPKTFDERAALLAERGVVTPTQTPDQELLYYYYELKPELKYNWESGRMENDYDTYYAYMDALLESLSPAFRERLMARIQNDWTPMEKLYWEFSRTYARPYRNLRDIVLREYTPEQVKMIRRFEVARGDERDALLEVMGPEGKLISSYQSKLREARLRLRILDPELDAWLYFFGTTDKFMSAESKEIYNNLAKQYLVPSMVGEVK